MLSFRAPCVFTLRRRADAGGNRRAALQLRSCSAVQHEELPGRARQEGREGKGRGGRAVRNVAYQTSHLSFISVESSRMEPSVNMMHR